MAKEVRVFLSYSLHDGEITERLASSLKAIIPVKFTNFPPDENVRPGDDIISRVHDHIEDSDVVIFIISKGVMGSNWLPLEMAIALASRNDENKKLLVPTLFSSEAEIPFLIRNLKYIDFRNPDDFNVNVSTLGSAIASYVDGDTREELPAIWHRGSRSANLESYLEFSKEIIREEYFQGRIVDAAKGIRLETTLTLIILVIALLVAGLILVKSSAENFDPWSGAFLGIIGAVVGYLFGSRSFKQQVAIYPQESRDIISRLTIFPRLIFAYGLRLVGTVLTAVGESILEVARIWLSEVSRFPAEQKKKKRKKQKRRIRSVGRD